MSLFREQEIAVLTVEIITHMMTLDEDIGVKIAALRSAADILSNAVTSRSLAQLIATLHDPARHA